MAVLILDVEQGSEQWHQEREENYTGSNADKLLTSEPQFKIVNGKKMPYAVAVRDNFKGNFHTERGHELEEEAIAIYGRIHDTTVLRPGIYKNTAYQSCIYSPDGVHVFSLSSANIPNGASILLEVKCFSKENHLKIYNGDIPVKIMAQIQYGMLITGLRSAILIIYNPHFAKKEIVDENGFAVPNPDYDPAKAYKEIKITKNRNIQNNFKSKLSATLVA